MNIHTLIPIFTFLQVISIVLEVFEEVAILLPKQESPPALTRKRHTNRGVASPCYGGWGGTYPGGGGTYSGGGVPTLVGGTYSGGGGTYPRQGRGVPTLVGGTYPRWGGTYPRWGVATLVGGGTYPRWGEGYLPR